MANDMVSKMSHLIPVGKANVNSDDLTPRHPVGTISFVNDGYGFRVMEYCRNISGSAIAKGELQKKSGNTAISNILSGSTTTVVTTGLTANTMRGQILYIDDNDDSAGAAPEGESGIIVSNTTTTITIDSGRPFTVAPAVNDEARVVYSSALVDAADGDLSGNVRGVCLASGGVTNLQYGWWQRYGYCPDVIHKNSACVDGEPVVADTAQVGPWGSDAVSLWVGHQVGTFTADNAHLYSPVFLQLFGFAYPHS